MLPPRQSLKALSLSVSFNGWRFPSENFKSWATKMSALHELTWKKAGIFEAVIASSTIKICKEPDLVMGVAEKWCPDTKTFLFPWGEATVTLEDVMVLLGFSVLGSPVLATLDSSGEEETKAKVEREWVMLKKDLYGRGTTQPVWMKRFMDSGDELEHVAFLVLWLSYFVFPPRCYIINEAVFQVAVHLSSGTRIALAPAVLAHLELRPKPSLLLQGQPRLARWDEVKQGKNDVRKILDNSKMMSFEWQPYTKAVENWKLPNKARKRVVLSPSHPPSSALGGAMGIVMSSKKSCDDERCGSIVEKMTLIDYVTKETEFSLHEDGAITGDKESSESLIHNDETGWKNMVRSPNNSSDPPLGFGDPTHDTHVSPPLETKQTCDDEIDVHGSNVEKMTVPDDGNKEPECLLHEDGGMSGEKESSEKKEDEILIQTKFASNADNNDLTPCENLAHGGSEVLGESKSGNPLGDEAQGDDCLFDDTVLGSEEPMKSSEQLEKRKEDVGDGNDLYEKSLHNVKELASLIEKLALSIDERIAKAERNVAWLKAMRAAKQRKAAAAAARLI
ncbi:unnamed protein product [Brassica oleracea var. botrytis]